MFTNELKKGDKVRLQNGWDATIEDNLKGNIRLATVYGFVTEMGSVYSHDIIQVHRGGRDMTMDEAKQAFVLDPIEHTPAQLKLKEKSAAVGF